MIQEIYNDSGTLLKTVEVPVASSIPNVIKTAALNTTAANFKTLVLNSQLSPGTWYKITDATPLILGNPIKAYVFAQEPGQNEFKGYGTYYNGTNDLECELGYVCNSYVNTVNYIKDTRNNTVYNTNNIVNFPWGISVCSDNYVDNTSTINVGGGASISRFVGNKIINSGTLTITGGTIASFSNNTVQGLTNISYSALNLTSVNTTGSFSNNLICDASNINISSATFAYFTFNTFKSVSSFNVGTVTTFKNNYFVSSDISITGGGSNQFLGNKIEFSTFYDGCTTSPNYTNNFIQNSQFTIDDASYVNDIVSNEIINNSNVDLRSFETTYFGYNKISGILYFHNFASGPIQYNELDIPSGNIMYLEGTCIGNIEYNKLFRSNILTASGGATIDGAISFNILNDGSTVNLNNSTLLDFTYNQLFSSSVVITSSVNTTAYTYNIFNSCGINIIDNTSLTQCEVDGILTYPTLNTGLSYTGCRYKINEYSTFYAEVDFSNATIFSSGTFYIPTDLTDIIGLYLVTNAVSNPILTDIVNFPTYHKFVLKSYGNQFRISQTSTISFSGLISNAFGNTFTLGSTATNTDWAELDYRISPFGPGNNLSGGGILTNVFIK